MSACLAYFLTWTTYGTRLHGDERGSISRWQKRRGEPPLSPDTRRAERESKLLSYDPIILTDHAREVVATAIRDHASFRGWRLLTLNVRTNYVHVVIDCRSEEAPTPEGVLGELKSWGTRYLRRARLARVEGPIWTYHGSTRWLNDEKGLQDAVQYVRDFQ